MYTPKMASPYVWGIVPGSGPTGTWFHSQTWNLKMDPDSNHHFQIRSTSGMELWQSTGWSFWPLIFFIAHRSFSSTPSHPPDKDWAPVIGSDLDDHTKPVHVQQEDGKLGREWKNWKDLAKRASPKKTTWSSQDRKGWMIFHPNQTFEGELRCFCEDTKTARFLENGVLIASGRIESFPCRISGHHERVQSGSLIQVLYLFPN